MNKELSELQKQQLAFLEETVEFYQKNPRSRRKEIRSDNIMCLYYHPTLPGCAIGRHIADKKLCKELDKVGGLSKKSMSSETYIRIPWSLRKLGRKFLVAIQDLHDTEDNWNTPQDVTGIVAELTSNGVYKVEEIKVLIKNYCYTINKEEFINEDN